MLISEREREREGGRRERRMSDNEKGLILAVASSLFIGTSFILKKKGLKRAAASGTRAGQSQFHSKSISRSLRIVQFSFIYSVLSRISIKLS